MIETPLGTVRFSGTPRLASITAPDQVTAVAAVWQLTGPTDGLTLAATLTGLPADAHGGPASGESLDAVTFENTGAALSIGGPDVEQLRYEAGRNLPARWAELLADDCVTYRSAGIGWRLPALLAGEPLAMAAVVAWRVGTRPEDDVSTWLAVDVSTSQVLSQLG